MQLPSASNTAGTAIGGLASAAILASAPSWPFVISAAAALGMTPVGLAGVIAVGVSLLANYGVTHIAEVKNLNGLVATWYPQFQYTYPAGKNSNGNLQS
jgi:hypothetical protein